MEHPAPADHCNIDHSGQIKTWEDRYGMQGATPSQGDAVKIPVFCNIRAPRTWSLPRHLAKHVAKKCSGCALGEIAILTGL